MELLAVRTARLITLFPTEELNPRGRAVIFDVAPALVERYNFLKHPQNFEEFDEQKGITFEGGRWNDLAIDRITIYTNGILVDTRSSTDDSEKILVDALSWAAESFGFVYKPEMIKQRLYLSELLVRSEVALNALNPKLKVLSEWLSKTVSNILGQPLNYEAVGIGFNFDPFATKHTPTSLRIERLSEATFSENKYYTTAPLPTNEHIKFLEDFEAALKG